MIPILQNIKSSKLMNRPRLLIYAKTGLTRTLFLTTKNVMARKSVQSAGVQTAISQKAAPARAVTLLCRFSTRITVQRSSSYARFVTPHFFPMKEGFQLQSYNALTVAGHWLQKKKGNTLSYINASIQNALIILTTSKRLIKLTLLKNMAKINISSTTSTASSRWIFSAWT